MTQDTQFSMEAFVAHAQNITRAFEKRRAQFLHKLKFRAVIAGVLLFTFPFWYSLLTRWDELDTDVYTVGALAVHVLAAIIIIMIIVAYAVHPLFRYRYDTFSMGASLPGATGVVHQPVTLKEQIFTELFKYFGDFRMYSDRKMSLRSFRKAPNLTEFDEYDCTDYIKGQFDGVAVEIAEVKLAVIRDNSRIKAFHGLMIILDINDSNLVLRGKFDGKTVLINKQNTGHEFIAEKYDGYRLVNFAEATYAQKLEGFSTEPAEAEKILSADMLRSLLKLSGIVSDSKNQTRSIDDKIAYALERIASGLGDVMAAGGAALLSWFKTGSFNTVSARHKVLMEPKEISSSARAFGNEFQCAFYDDKVLISIPTAKNLFEPDSVFQVPLTREDVVLAYGLLNETANIVRAVIAGLAKENT